MTRSATKRWKYVFRLKEENDKKEILKFFTPEEAFRIPEGNEANAETSITCCDGVWKFQRNVEEEESNSRESVSCWDCIRSDVPYAFWRLVCVFIFLLLIIVVAVADLSQHLKLHDQKQLLLIFFSTWGWILLTVDTGLQAALVIYYMNLKVSKQRTQRSTSKTDESETSMCVTSDLPGTQRSTSEMDGNDITICVIRDLPGRIYTLCSVSWFLESITMVASVAITLGYWIVIWTGREQGYLTSVYCIVGHTFNGLYVVINRVISARPVYLIHMWASALFAAVYLIFMEVYCKCGGINPVDGNNYIYKQFSMDNWKESLKNAVIIFAFMILGHALSYGIYRLKKKVLPKATNCDSENRDSRQTDRDNDSNQQNDGETVGEDIPMKTLTESG